MRIIKVIQPTNQQRLQQEEGFRKGKSHAFRMRCRAILLKASGLTSKEVGVKDFGNPTVSVGGCEAAITGFLSQQAHDACAVHVNNKH